MKQSLLCLLKYRFKLVGFFACLLLFTAQLKAVSDSISLVSPVQNAACDGSYTTFKWSGLIQNTTIERNYLLEVVQVNEGQTPKEAFEQNTLFTTYYTSATTSNEITSYVFNGTFPLSSVMAWRVKAARTDNNVIVAESRIQTFTGLPLLNGFYAGNETVLVNSTKGSSLTKFSGTGTSEFMGKKRNVYFNNIKVERSGALLLMRSGVVYATAPDSFNIDAEDPANGKLKLYGDTLYLGTDWPHIKGHLKWNWNIMDTTITVYPKGDIEFDDRPIGDIKLPNLSIPVKGMPGWSLSVDSTSVVYIRGSYDMYLDAKGKINTVCQLGDTAFKKMSYSYALHNLTDIYFTVNSKDTIYLKKDFSIASTSATIDLSSHKSPSVVTADTLWRGVIFNNFDVRANIADTVTKITGCNFSITANPENQVKFNHEPLIVDINKSLSNPLRGEYCNLSASFSKIRYSMRIPDSCYLKGSVEIPYIYGPPQGFKFDFDRRTIKMDSLQDIIFPTPNSRDLLEFYICDGEQRYKADIDNKNFIISSDWPKALSGKKAKFYYITNGAFVYYYPDMNPYYRSNVELDSAEFMKLYIVVMSPTRQQRIYSTKNLQTATSEFLTSSSIRVFPNPVRDVLTIVGLPEASVVTLIGVTGTQAFKQVTNNTTEYINISDLNSGLYILKIQSKKGVLTQTILKL
ncbi:MAG TPA: T9SS type A sorting domain-containing protein [Bacteroidales bacterium]|nr:T9SS type A sorting domain-containing protein [Bacteroidales bacterium]